jgi:hypothetical protein
MSLYGHAAGTSLDEYGLLELRDVTISTSVEALREIAAFLASCATAIEGGTFTHGHLHIETAVRGWRRRFPKDDIIVAVQQ